jgi:O-antigen/teichoic acid export membrane protein
MSASTPKPPDSLDADSVQEDPTGLHAVTSDRSEYSDSMFMVMFSQYAVMQIVLAATALVRNKVIALRLGPSAFGEIAQLGAVVASLVVFVSLGMQVSLSRNVARAGTHAERQAYLANANGLVLLLSVLVTGAALALLATGDLLTVVGLPVTRVVVIAAVLFSAGIPLIVLQTNFLSVLQGQLDVKGLALRRSLAVLLATAACVPLVWVFGLVGAAVTTLILNALLALLLGLRCRSLGYQWLEVRLNRDVIVVLLSFGLASMAAGFAATFADTAVRASLLKQFGTDAMGLVQAPLVLAASLQAVVVGSIGSMALAAVSRASSHDETGRTIDRLLKVSVPLSTVAFSLLGLLGVPIIIALYSGQFAGGAALLPWILCADLVQVAVWVVGATLLAYGDRAIWLALELVWSGAELVISLALLPRFGAVAYGMGMLFAIVIHLALNLVMVQVRYNLRIGWANGARLLAGLAIVALVAVIGAYWTTSAPAMIAASVIWLAYASYVVRSTPLPARFRSVLPGG